MMLQSAILICALKDYNNFHRIDIHKQLLKSAFEDPGEGPACLLKVNHQAVDVNAEEGIIRFENEAEVTADLVVAADGIRVRLKLKIVQKLSHVVS